MKTSSQRNKGDAKFTVIIILLLVQIAMLGLVLVNQYDLLPLKPVKQVFSGYSVNGVHPIPPELVGDDEISPAELQNPIRVEVLNGCGVKGLAGKTAEFLRRKGYDVRDFRNAPRSYQHTTIFVRNGDMASGEALAYTISLPQEMVKMENDPTLVDIDVTLILGHDYQRFILPQ